MEKRSRGFPAPRLMDVSRNFDAINHALLIAKLIGNLSTKLP